MPGGDLSVGPREVGVFARCYARPRLEQVLDAARADGFRLLHFNLSCAGLPSLPPALDEPAAIAIARAVERRGMVMWTLSGTFNAIHPDVARRRRDTARAQALIARSRLLGAGIVTLSTGTRDPDDTWRYHPANAGADAWTDLRATLAALLEVAEAAGVTLGIEPEPGNVVADAAMAARLIAEMGSPRLRVVLDPANLVLGRPPDEHERVLRRAIELLAPVVVCCHAKDVRGGAFTAVGRGDLDYATCLRLLADAGITAPLILQDVEEADIPRARAYLLDRAR